MASRKRTVEIEVVADTDQAERKLKGVGGKVDVTGGKFDKAGSLIRNAMGVVALGGVTRFADNAIGSFSELEQSVGGTEAVFGDASRMIDQFAKNSADAMGLSEAEFRTATTAIGGQLKRMTGDVGFAAEQSVILTGVAADLAATYGGTTAEAVQALGAAFRGEADPAERFNLDLKIGKVNAKAIEMGLGDAKGKVDDYGRAQALLALIMEQSNDAQGQFARESDTVSGKLQRMEAAAEDAAAALGSWLAPFKLELGEIAGDIIAIGDGVASIGGEEKGFGDLVGSFFDWAPILGDVKRSLESTADLMGDESTWSIEKHKQIRDVFGETRDRLHNYVGEAEDAVEVTEDLAVGQDAAARMADLHREALKRQTDALYGLGDPVRAFIDGLDDITEAEQKAIDAWAEDDRLMDAFMRLRQEGIDPTSSAAQHMFDKVGLPPSLQAKLIAQWAALEARLKSMVLEIPVSLPTFRGPIYGSGGSVTGWREGDRVTFHEGGIVPGLPGENVPIMAQAGEEITRRAEVGRNGASVINHIYVSNPSNVLVAELMELRRRGVR